MQSLINVAQEYMCNHGLSFSPVKTFCSINGKNPLTKTPEWTLAGAKLPFSANLDYLGSLIGNGASSTHCDQRISKCRRSFYSLQGAGLCHQGLEVNKHIYESVDSSLSGRFSYGCDALYMNSGHRSKLDKSTN